MRLSKKLSGVPGFQETDLEVRMPTLQDVKLLRDWLDGAMILVAGEQMKSLDTMSTVWVVNQHVVR